MYIIITFIIKFQIISYSIILFKRISFKYICSIPIKTIFLKHLRELYKIYKIDLRFDLLPLSIYSKMDTLQKLNKKLSLFKQNYYKTRNFKKKCF